MLVVEFSDERNCVKSVLSWEFQTLQMVGWTWKMWCDGDDLKLKNILWSWKNTQNIKHDKWSLFSSLVRLERSQKNYIYFVVGINILGSALIIPTKCVHFYTKLILFTKKMIFQKNVCPGWRWRICSMISTRPPPPPSFCVLSSALHCLQNTSLPHPSLAT